MQVFSIMLFPLVLGYLLFQERYCSRPLWEMASAFFFSIPVVLLMQIGRVLVFPIDWANPFQMILVTWFFDFLIPSGAACYIYLKLQQKDLLSPTRPGFIWFSVFFFLPVLIKAVYRESFYGLYEYFYYPLICLCFAYLFSLWLARRSRHFFLNAFWAAILVLWSTVFPAMVAYAHYMQRPTVAFIIFLLYATFVANVIFFATLQLKTYHEGKL